MHSTCTQTCTDRTYEQAVYICYIGRGYIHMYSVLYIEVTVKYAYKLATADLLETVLSSATISMKWHLPHLTMTLTCLVVTVHNAIRGDSGTTPAYIQK